MPQLHGLCDGRHAENAHRPAEVTDGEVPGICRKLDGLDARSKGVISVFGRGVGRTRPRLEDVSVGGVEENPVAMGSRVPDNQPPSVRTPG